ncbi:uncharacterized protein LOC124894997 [Capsicum annuum]|uniref:uncharacterized protein LOC124894997 n=1 Tax=Capsicum annuum TaxID=4072 RepID=UPI001FB10184|nr:uncharacterized protein LOC124894997 [Capsicum annuum]
MAEQKKAERLAALARAQVNVQNLGQKARHQNPDDKDLVDEEFLNPQNLRRSEQVAALMQRNINRNHPVRGTYDDEPLLRWTRKRAGPKTLPPSKPIEVDDTDDTEVKTSFEQASEEQGSKHTEQESEDSEQESKNEGFKKPVAEETEFELLSSEQQGIKVELHAKKTHNPIRKDEIQPSLRLDRDAVGAVDPPFTETVSAPDMEVQSSEDVLPPLAYSTQVGSVPQSKLTTSVPPAATGSTMDDVEKEIPILDLTADSPKKRNKKGKKKGKNKRDEPDSEVERKAKKKAKKKAEKKDLKRA